MHTLTKKLKNKKTIKILWSRDILWSFVFLIIYSLIASSSNIWLLNLGSAIANGIPKSIYHYFVLFTASILLANIPETISNYYLTLSKLNAAQNYQNEFEKTHKNTTTLTFKSDIREQKEPWLIGEAEKTVDETLSVIHSSLGMILSSIFNIATLAIAIDSKLTIGYSISFISMALLFKYMNSPIKNLSLQSQKDRNLLRQTLLSSWDSISIGNDHNLNIWKRDFSNKLNFLRKSSGKFTILFGTANSVTMFAIMFPVIVNIFLLINNNISNPATLTTIVTTLHKQIGTLFSMHMLFTNTMQWTSTYYPRLCALIESTNRPAPREDIENSIKLKELHFILNKKNITFNSISEVLEMVDKTKNGRLTIRGDNGTGKSSILCLLKEILENKAFYLPANSKLFFENTKDVSLSSGQNVKIQLNEIFQILSKQPSKIILLDEWDANLDKTNIEEFSSRIDHLSETSLIFEVRHKIFPYDLSFPSAANSVPIEEKRNDLFFSKTIKTPNTELNFNSIHTLKSKKGEIVVNIEQEQLENKENQLEDKFMKKNNYKKSSWLMRMFHFG